MGVVEPTDGVDGLGPPSSAAESIPGGKGPELKAAAGAGAGCGGGGGGGVAAKCGAREAAAARDGGGCSGAGAVGGAALLLRPSCFSAMRKDAFVSARV